MKTKKHKEFEALIEPHYDRLYFYILGEVRDKELAEDLLQSTMESAWKSLDQLRNRESAYAWCIAIARNKINRFYRMQNTSKRSNKGYTELKTIDNLEALQDDILSEIIAKENWETVESALSQVKETNQTVLRMRLIADMSCKEIAQCLDMNCSTVRSRYARGLMQLRDLCRDISESEQ